MDKVVLAYSGGLDTSFCAVWLTKAKNLEVHAVLVNLGGFSAEEIAATEAKAYAMGVKHFAVINDEQRYYDDCIKYLVYGNVLKNNTYPLSVSSERAFQAVAIAEYAAKISAKYIAHGSTGAGNDQIRFDTIFNIVVPNIEILTPIRDLGLTRDQEIAYLTTNGVSVNFEKLQYSINKGLWGSSVGGKETLVSDKTLPDSAYPTPVSKSVPEIMELSFEKGELAAVNGETFASKVDAIRAVQAIAQPFGIGRDTHVGDTIIGIKGRVGFEAAAPLIIIKAHHLLEKHTLTKNQMIIKDQLSITYGNYLHDGLVFDPVLNDIEALFASSQTHVGGIVKIQLNPYFFTLIGIQSDNDLMSSKFATYGEINTAWTGQDAIGFSKIYSNGLSIYRRIHSEGTE